MDGTKRSAIIWVSIAAAAAGVAAVAATARWKEKLRHDQLVTEKIRGVQDLLADCYQKIHELG